MSTAVAVVLYLTLLGVHIWAITVCFRKGKPWMGLCGLLIGLFAYIGAIRIAKPDSKWARERYANDRDPLKLAIARRRFPEAAIREQLALES